MAEAFFNNHPHFKQLAQYLVSMQHIPNDLDMLGLSPYIGAVLVVMANI